MSNATETLGELVQIALDGKHFVEAGAAHTDNAELREMFAGMARAKQSLIDALASNLAEAGTEAPTHGTLYGGVREAYAQARAAMSGDEDVVYVDQIEETEDRLLQAFQEALAQADSVQTRQIVQRHLPAVQASHDRMRRLKAAIHMAA